MFNAVSINSLIFFNRNIITYIIIIATIFSTDIGIIVDIVAIRELFKPTIIMYDDYG
jgi:hypothetical protein